MLNKLKIFVPALVGVLMAMGPALAGPNGEVRSAPWQMWLQEPASPTADRIVAFNAQLLVIETLIVIFVLGLMAYIAFRFSAKKNPVPSKTTHHTGLEVAWTIIPIFILVGIAVPSLKHLYFADRTHDAEMTLKVTGNQWYWNYAYPDNGDFTFDSIIVPKDELKEGQPRLLTVDNKVVLPVETNIRILLTSADVIHNWAIPSLSVKIDTMPGRINETWTRIHEKYVGKTLYGMCSELCGVNHGFMPIAIQAVSKEDFAKWVKEAQEKFASDDTKTDGTVRLAAAGVPAITR
ncbi:cytochrome c oxidase subunit II [Thalassospiraceae bacterium LMO-JJ14]|nr:cytochrome c oxidase subunit II [Thalassospiraceae bacterium LMO-JJ14]